MTSVAFPQARGIPSRVWGWVRRAPVTAAFLAVLLVTTILLRHVIDNDVAVLRWASTNVHNLTTTPVQALVASAAFLPGGHWLLYAVVLVASLGVLERRFGSRWAVAVFASAHVLATLLTEAGVWVGIELGEVSRHALTRLDVGVSYGMFACIAAACLLVPVRWRRWLTAALALGVLVPLVADYDMTAAGHAISFAIGLAWWPILRGAARRNQPDLGRSSASAMRANQAL